MDKKQKPMVEPRRCPYCEEAIAEAAFPFCEACEVRVKFCPECKKPIPKGKQSCPTCGTAAKGKAAKGG